MTYRPFAWLRGLGRRRPTASQSTRPAVMEPVERRCLLSTSPVPVANPPAVAMDGADTVAPRLVNQQLIGPIDAVTQIKLTFSEPLDPATAQDVAAYAILRVFHQEGEEGGLFDDFVPFVDTSVGDSEGVSRLKIETAAYDDTTQTVTLTPRKPFRAGRFFRRLRVAGRGDHAVRDLSGNALDGNQNGRGGDKSLIFFRLRKNKAIAYREADGDRVNLKLTGGGKILALARKKGNPLPMVFITDATPGQSVLTGTVKKGKKGDGVADIPQVTGISTAQVTFLNDPAFRIGLTAP